MKSSFQNSLRPHQPSPCFFINFYLLSTTLTTFQTSIPTNKTHKQFTHHLGQKSPTQSTPKATKKPRPAKGTSRRHIGEKQTHGREESSRGQAPPFSQSGVAQRWQVCHCALQSRSPSPLSLVSSIDYTQTRRHHKPWPNAGYTPRSETLLASVSHGGPHGEQCV